MTMNEKRIRQIIREEAARALAGKRTLREMGEHGRWLVSDVGYELEDAPSDVENAWYEFTTAVGNLKRFADVKFEDTESGDMASVGEIAVHQAQTFLTER